MLSMLRVEKFERRGGILTALPTPVLASLSVFPIMDFIVFCLNTNSCDFHQSHIP